jgi:hypothetical protein
MGKPGTVFVTLTAQKQGTPVVEIGGYAVHSGAFEYRGRLNNNKK